MARYLIPTRGEGTNSQFKYYYYNDALKPGEMVIINDQGFNYLRFVGKDEIKEIDSFADNFAFIERVATRDDIKRYYQNKDDCLKVTKYVEMIAKRMSLPMKFLTSEYSLDNQKLLIVYSSDERIDFRMLLKEVTSTYRSRIELRQINPRERARLIGGISGCGMPICCKTFLIDSESVTINLAKNQMLAINIQKMSGICGKLMCCLKYEDEMYTNLRKEFPHVGSSYFYEGSTFTLISYNVLSRICKLEGNDSIVYLSLKEVKSLKRNIKNEREIVSSSDTNR